MVKTIYRRGADDGLIFGIYLSVLFLMLVFSIKVVILSIPALIMTLGVPGMIFFFLRRCYVAEKGMTQFSGLWMLGILIFVFGSLICGVVTYIYLQFIEPTFIYDQVKSALAIYQSIPELKDSEPVLVIQKAVSENLLPNAIQFVIQMIWLTSFSGSILSMLTAAIVRAFKIKNVNL